MLKVTLQSACGGIQGVHDMSKRGCLFTFLAAVSLFPAGIVMINWGWNNSAFAPDGLVNGLVYGHVFETLGGIVWLCGWLALGTAGLLTLAGALAGMGFTNGRNYPSSRPAPDSPEGRALRTAEREAREKENAELRARGPGIFSNLPYTPAGQWPSDMRESQAYRDRLAKDWDDYTRHETDVRPPLW